MNKHEITSLWINLKYIKVFVWNNGTVYSKKYSKLVNGHTINSSRMCLLHVSYNFSNIVTVPVIYIFLQASPYCRGLKNVAF